MISVLLINPNTSRPTTDMMVAIAQSAAPQGVNVIGVTARSGVPMILDADALMKSGPEVVEMGCQAASTISGIIVSAFGDPGVELLRRKTALPLIGIAEAAMREAAQGGRRFGIATVTPGLVDAINRRAISLGLADLYTGTRLTNGDPMALMAHPDKLVEALAEAIDHCIGRDGAEAVVIGGGPLGDAGTALASRYQNDATPVIAPIPASIRRMVKLLLI